MTENILGKKPICNDKTLVAISVIYMLNERGYDVKSQDDNEKTFVAQ